MQVRDFRLTAVSTQSFLTRVLENDRHQLWARLTDRLVYRATYNQLQGGAAVPDLARPWRSGQKSNFWLYYLGSKDTGALSAETAWASAIPFRLLDMPAALFTDDAKDRVYYECFGYPHGLVLTVTIQSRRIPRLLPDFCKRARSLGMEYVFTLAWNAGERETALSLKSVTEKLLSWYRFRYYDEIKNFRTTPRPVTIVTVVQGDDAERDKPLDANPDLQRILYGVTAWPELWETTQLPPLVVGTTLLPTRSKDAVPANCVYAAERGRAIWLPSLFTLKTPPNSAALAKKPHQLSCFHHNMVASTVQVESLGGFAGSYADTDADQRVGVPKDMVERACLLLAALYAGDRGQSYRSWSARALVAQPAFRKSIDALFESAKQPKIQFA
jgi:hypothetical protein